MDQSTPTPSSGPAPAASLFGRLPQPTVIASVTGPCGDAMEFSLRIVAGVITELRYATNGCGATQLCGEAVGRRALGRTVIDALSLSARDILDELPELGPGHRHCAILAVSTLYRTLGTHWVIELLQASNPAPNAPPAKGSTP